MLGAERMGVWRKYPQNHMGVEEEVGDGYWKSVQNVGETSIVKEKMEGRKFSIWTGRNHDVDGGEWFTEGLKRV